MSDVAIQLTDPEQLQKLLAQVEGLKEVFSNAARLEAERSTRGKYTVACKNLRDSDLPYIELNTTTFKNKSIASMRSQFKRTAEEMELGFIPSVVEYDEKLLLVNFDAEQASEKFNSYILKLAGVSEQELYKLAADLDKNTK